MTRKSTKLVAEICLYGSYEVGIGWLAQLADGRLLGTGEPVHSHSMTQAVYCAREAIQEALGTNKGRIRIYMVGGQKMAETCLDCSGYFGDLRWTPAIQYTVSADQILAAAQ